MKEETRSIRQVGNYSVAQGDTKDCVVCRDAHFATMIIDGVCIDCFQAALQGYKKQAKED